MKPSDQAVREFQEMWHREFGQLLTLDEARAKATLLLDLCRIIVRPLPGEAKYSGASVITF